MFAELAKKTVKSACFAFVVLKIQPIFDIHINNSKSCMIESQYCPRVNELR